MSLPTSNAVADPRRRADYVMIGTTQSLCPDCMEVVPAKIITRGRRVYFRKQCPSHGMREDFVCSDVAWWDRLEGQTASVLPQQRSTKASSKGCPHDCGLCEEHEQHTCIGLVELTDRCNLSCPMCFASSGPSGKDHSFEDIERALDRLVETEGRAEVCQLSGGEPTLHPEFRRIVDAALDRPIDYVMINTNGIRLANDPSLVEFLKARRDRVEIYFQWDGDDRNLVTKVRGEDVVDPKRRSLDRLEAADIHVTLVSTLVSPLPDRFYDGLWREAMRRRNVVGLSLQPATYSGRYLSPDHLEQRVTFPDVIRDLAMASDGMVAESDFSPLPCAHPNCHQILLAARSGEAVVPIAGGETALQNLDLIAGGISFTPERAKKIVDHFLARHSQCGTDCGCGPTSDPVSLPIVGDHQNEQQNAGQRNLGESDRTDEQSLDPRLLAFFAKVFDESATAKDLFRITITNFLDAYNFDIRQMMKCCTHHVLPSGHVVPFCAYNTLYRPGHLKLPPLSDEPREC